MGTEKLIGATAGGLLGREIEDQEGEGMGNLRVGFVLGVCVSAPWKEMKIWPCIG
jgi:hypothetical protein